MMMTTTLVTIMTKADDEDVDLVALPGLLGPRSSVQEHVRCKF